MFRINFKLLLLTIVNVFAFETKLFTNNKDPLQIIHQMIDETKKIKTLRYQAIINERIDGKMIEKFSFFKINIQPLKLYVSQQFMGINLDGLYVEGWNNNKLLVATIGFPWLQLSLDPLGSRVRNNHHHTIFEAGYSYFANIIEKLLINNLNELSINYLGLEKYHNQECFKIKIEIKNYRINQYTLAKGENISSVAKKFLINDYKILELNPQFKSYNEGAAGKVIKIPNYYAQKLVLYINKQSFLPALLQLYDEIGLYAEYGFINVLINKPFEADEFSPTYKNYHFKN